MSHDDEVPVVGEQTQVWYTPTEAATYLRVARPTIYRYMEMGLLPYYELKSGGGRRLRRSDLDAVLERPRVRRDGKEDAE